MNLVDRFHRLTLWNKIAACGALASIVGVALSVYLLVPPSDIVSRRVGITPNAPTRVDTESSHVEDSSEFHQTNSGSEIFAGRDVSFEGKVDSLFAGGEHHHYSQSEDVHPDFETGASIDIEQEWKRVKQTLPNSRAPLGNAQPIGHPGTQSHSAVPLVVPYDDSGSGAAQHRRIDKQHEVAVRGIDSLLRKIRRNVSGVYDSRKNLEDLCTFGPEIASHLEDFDAIGTHVELMRRQGLMFLYTIIADARSNPLTPAHLQETEVAIASAECATRWSRALLLLVARILAVDPQKHQDLAQLISGTVNAARLRAAKKYLLGMRRDIEAGHLEAYGHVYAAANIAKMLRLGHGMKQRTENGAEKPSYDPTLLAEFHSHIEEAERDPQVTRPRQESVPCVREILLDYPCE